MRGALIVLEGCDAAGKTTQCKKILAALKQKEIQAQFMSFPVGFPDRTTAIGKLINDYLKKIIDLPDKAVHLLFSANRWELEPKMNTLLKQGITLIVDRYSYSGVAFSSAKKGMEMSWCRESDRGLPKPDLVLMLELSPSVASNRAGFGTERYEDPDFQKRVTNNFHLLHDDTWKVIDADKEVDILNKELMTHVVAAIERARQSPLLQLC